jgi:hypothetical protein
MMLKQQKIPISSRFLLTCIIQYGISSCYFLLNPDILLSNAALKGLVSCGKGVLSLSPYRGRIWGLVFACDKETGA